MLKCFPFILLCFFFKVIKLLNQLSEIFLLHKMLYISKKCLMLKWGSAFHIKLFLQANARVLKYGALHFNALAFAERNVGSHCGNLLGF